MTTVASDVVEVPGEIWAALLRSFAAKARPRAVSISFQAFPAAGQTQEPPEIQCLESTTRALNRLPWRETILPDGRIAPKPEAAASLLWLLLNALEDSTINPTAIIPTSRGGVAAEWHILGIDLEIECDPDGTIEYNFAAPETEEYEGPVDADLSQLKRHIGMLPKRPQ